jgi:formate hydrogenlyase subunit 4
MIESIFAYGKPLIVELPLIFLALLYVLTIKLRKSPFDFSTSHHGHQELIKGITTEFSGPQLAIIELTHWYETVLVLGFVSLFFATPIWIGIIIALVCFGLELIIDNISARVTWRWMLKYTWMVGAGAALVNIIWLYVKRG